MSVNDILTIVVAAAAVAVSLIAIFISSNVDRRATRSALTDLTLKISKGTAEYEALTSGDKFEPSREIEMLVLQAEDLIPRLTTRFRKRALFPESSVAATLAMALDKVNDFWWSDRYWRTAVGTADPYFHAYTGNYWGAALCRRGDFTRGRVVVEEGLAGLDALVKAPSDPPDASIALATEARIARGDICLNMIQWDHEKASTWLARAKQEYQSIPQRDDRYKAYAPDGKAFLNLISANLSTADLTGADLTNADLTNADLTNADLTGADLTGADLTNANLTNANLTNANLTNADLTDAVLNDVNLTGAIVSDAATLPHGWTRDPDSGRSKPAY